MPMKRLKPIRVNDRLAEPIAEEIEWHLWDLIFKPILDILKDETGIKVSLENSKVSLIAALRAGRVQYNDGYWSGQFSSAISKDLRSYGAKFDHGRKMFKLSADVLPYDLKQAVIASVSKADALYKRLTKELDQIEENNRALTGPVIQIKDKVQSMFVDIDEQFEKTTSKEFEIPVRIDPELRAKLTAEYSANLNLSIQTFRDDQVFKLRQQVEDNFKEGFRSTEMVNFIQAQYGVTQRKARFLARQETSLLTHAYKTEKYKDVGITKYQWSTSHDSRTRTDHKALDGRVFSYDDPPITDTATGARNNPGQDFGCRCFPEDSKLDLAYGIEKLFRRRYTGKLTTVVLNSGKTVRATPNHQVLTSLGWKAIGSLNVGDNLIDLSEQLIKPSKANVNDSVPSIGEIFETACKFFNPTRRKVVGSDFHGDGTDADVDIVKTFQPLRNWSQANHLEFFKQLFFSLSDALAFCLRRIFWELFVNSFFGGRSSCGESNRFLFRFCGPLKPQKVSLTSASDMASSLQKSDAYRPSLNPGPFANRKLAFPGFVRFYDFLRIKLASIFNVFPSRPSVGLNADSPEMLRNIVGVKADFLGDFFKRNPGIKKFDCVVKVTSENQSLHVYNLQTVNGWYSVEGIMAHNCQDIPIVDEGLQAEMRKAAPIQRGVADRRQVRAARPWHR